MYSSGSSTPDLGYYKLPPIITTEADREFLNEINAFIDSELEKINHLDEEQRYLVYKTVFNKVIEHVTSYKPVLVQIKKEYEDTIDTIKKGQREATFLQEKLKAMASEPSTLRNYRKRGDELEERITILRKKNEQLQQELQQIRNLKEEKEKRPKTAEKPERELKKDSRLIPGLSIEDSTDMKVLQKKHETLDRQLKELSLSLRARFLPKTHKLQLKESLDNKVAYRDQLLWQSQVYKARGQKLKIALEAAQAYNQMKPPHQTVGDAVTIAFQQASGMLKAEREKTEGEQADSAQTATFEDDDPNKEKEAEMMLEYIEKFNELFEDGLFEEAAVHAANSPKGILRTQATLAKFRDVKVKTKGRSPLLAFCDSIMSSVKAAGSRPNEALSMDCMEACLNENRLDLAYHWLSQDRLSQSLGLGKLISEHCSCPLPCKCGCQALAQSVFTRLKSHQDVVLTMLKQGKYQGALQHGQLRQCINDENIVTILTQVCNQSIVTVPDLNFGSLLSALVGLEKIEMVSNLIQMMLKPSSIDGDATTTLLSLQSAVMQDTATTQDQWMVVLEMLSIAGFQDSLYQLLAMTFVVDIVQQAWKAEKVDKKKGGISFPEDIEMDKNDDEKGKDSNKVDNCDNDDDDDDAKLDDDAKESSIGLSSRSRDDTNTSIDHSSRETSPEIGRRHGQVAVKESILKKRHHEKQHEQDPSSSECTPRKSPPVVRKRVMKISRKKGGTAAAKDQSNDDDDDDDVDDNEGNGSGKERSAGRRRVRMNLTLNSTDMKRADREGERSVEFNDDATQIIGQANDSQGDSEAEIKSVEVENRVCFENQEEQSEQQKNVNEQSNETNNLNVKFEIAAEDVLEESHTNLNEIGAIEAIPTEEISTNEEVGLKTEIHMALEIKESAIEDSELKESMPDVENSLGKNTKPELESTNDGLDGDNEQTSNIGEVDKSSSPRVKFVDDVVKDDSDEIRIADQNGDKINDSNSPIVKSDDNGVDCAQDEFGEEEKKEFDHIDMSNSRRITFADEEKNGKEDNEICDTADVEIMQDLTTETKREEDQI